MTRPVTGNYKPVERYYLCRYCGKLNDHEFKGQVCKCASMMVKMSLTEVAARKAVMKFLTLSPA